MSTVPLISISFEGESLARILRFSITETNWTIDIFWAYSAANPCDLPRGRSFSSWWMSTVEVAIQCN